NTHPPVLDYRLRPNDWSTLRLVHDPDTDSLHVEDADSRKLRILPLGAGHPGLFPPPLSIATGLVISGRLYSGLIGEFPTTRGWNGHDTLACPRLSVGDVIVARRRWYGGTELTEKITAEETESQKLSSLTAWRARHGVPEEVVFKTTPADEGPQS